MDASEADQETAAIWAALEAWRGQHPRTTFDEIEDEVYRQLAGLHAQWSASWLSRPPRSP